nr:hypothetical protein [Tanacetum cinerariifolium]
SLGERPEEAWCCSGFIERNQSSNPTSSTNPNPKGRNRKRSKQRIKNVNLEELSPPLVTIADPRTIAQLLQAPTKGYEDAIVVLAITADNFELNHGAARIWLEKEPPRSIFTWDDLVSKFINQFFPPSKTTSLRNEITNFQRFDESFSEAWDRFKDLLRASPHHGFSELHQLDTFYNALNSKDQDSLNSAAGEVHQLDTFYNALNSKDQDSLNSAAGGNFLDKMPHEYLAIIESKSKVHYSCDKPIFAKVSTNVSTSGVSPDVAELKDMVKALLLDKKSQKQSHVLVKAVEEIMLLAVFVNSNSASTSSSSTLPSNTIANPKSDLKAITTRSGVSYDGPEATKDTVSPTNNGNTKDVQPQVVQSEYPVSTSNPVTSLISEPAIAPVSASKSNPKASIPYPSRRNDERNPLIENKEKLSEMARTPLNEHCSAVLLKKLREKLGDPGKFLIPCYFLGMAECLALADLTASINLMPFFVWKRFSLPDLTPTFMTLELDDRSICRPVGVTEDVYVKIIPYDRKSFYRCVRSDMTTKRINVIDMACEEYSQKVLGFSDTISSGNPTPYYDTIVSATSSTLTPFGNSDFLLEEVDAFLAIEDEPTSSELHQSYLEPEGKILLLEHSSMMIHHYPLRIKEIICLKFARNLKYVKLNLTHL